MQHAFILQSFPNSADQLQSLPNSADQLQSLPNSADQLQSLPNSADQLQALPNQLVCNSLHILFPTATCTTSLMHYSTTNLQYDLTLKHFLTVRPSLTLHGHCSPPAVPP